MEQMKLLHPWQTPGGGGSTHHRSARSRPGRPRSRSRRHTAIVWRCTCSWSRRTGSTNRRSLKRKFNAVNQTKGGGKQQQPQHHLQERRSIFNQNTTRGLALICPPARLFSSEDFLLMSRHQCGCHRKLCKYHFDFQPLLLDGLSAITASVLEM